MERKKMFDAFEAATKCLGSYDEFPTMPKGTDPMPCLSRNRVPQPMHLISANDEVLIAMAGRSVLHLPGASPTELTLQVGEAVYIPAGQPSRVIPTSASIHIRYKPEPPGWEAAAWYCDSCGHEIFRCEFNPAERLAQECYWDACEQFNADEELRTCAECGLVASTCDLTDIRWREVADMIREGDTPASTWDRVDAR